MGGKPSQPVVAKRELLPTALNLGDNRLELQNDGKWLLVSGMSDAHISHLNNLEENIVKLETDLSKALDSNNRGNVAFKGAGGAAGELIQKDNVVEKEVVKLKRRTIELEEEVDHLRWKNKVLLAMCTLKEHDYQTLCDEAGLAPSQRERLKRKKNTNDGARGKRQRSTRQGASTSSSSSSSFTHEIAVKARGLLSWGGAVRVELMVRSEGSPKWKTLDKTEALSNTTKPKFERPMRIQRGPNKDDEYKLVVVVKNPDRGVAKDGRAEMACAFFTYSDLIEGTRDSTHDLMNEWDRSADRQLDENGANIKIRRLHR